VSAPTPPSVGDGKVWPLAVATPERTACGRTSPRSASSASRASTPPPGKKSLGDLGVDIVGSTPDEFIAYLKAEIQKWNAIVKAPGVKPV